jgi:hypothetical protein
MYEIAKMTRELNESMINEDPKNFGVFRENAAKERDSETYVSSQRELIYAREAAAKKKADFLQNVKEAFVTEAVLKIYKESSVTPLTNRDKVIAKNLVSRFVKEQGAGDLINSWATKNVLLSEVSRITQKYYNKVLETFMDDYALDTTIKDDFFEELEDLDVTDAAKLIRERVADSIQQFTDTNFAAKLDYEDIIKQAQERIAAANDEGIAEQYSIQAKRKINEMKLNMKKNVFNIMVESLARKAVTDESYKKIYMNESKLDIDKVVEDTTLIYTMLEMVNTTKMIKVDEKVIADYLNI